MDEKPKNKTLSEKLYNMNVLPLENLRGTDITNVVLLNIQDKSDDKPNTKNQENL